MFMFTKLAFFTCVFYLGISVLLDAVFIGAARLGKGSFAIVASRSIWMLFFGITWLVSFLASYRITVAPIFAKIQNR